MLTSTDKDQQSTDLANVRGHSDWKWYGFAGHLIISDRCAYHLSTRVGNYLVSTVGAFKRDHRKTEYESIGVEPDDLFETMVFTCIEEKDGEPIVADYIELDARRYATSLEAELGHYEFCWRYHNEG